ncbi:hypothetical protein GPECTOR_25g332 [Gonium pectorale]|uniref:NEF1-like protein n=1 Tax=Gonium pectorale TaxID=33097 RepID=A0A150GFY6_GONPE|nr:hypothetical protein GPECTOR_25g332 [Gonium pectorale]|eukprot:KXZ48748.1 hypothetical protein GPECTOR_25g332 [Gonium pectorale]
MSAGYYPPPGAPVPTGYSGISVSPSGGSLHPSGSFQGLSAAPSRGATSRFAPGPFRYNGRVAAALLPCLLTVAVIGGTPVLACLTLGAMVVYLMDALGYREGAFSCIWVTLASAAVAFAATLLSTSDAPVGLQIGMLFAMTALCALTGAWGSLQFRWLQMQYPAAAIYFERLLLTASLPLAALLQPLGLATFVSYSDVPYYLGVLLAGLYYMLGRPLVSSFYNLKAGPGGIGGGPAIGPEAVVQKRADGALMAALVAFLPPAVYAAVHWVVLSLPLHIYAMLLLAGGMPLVLALLPGGLWWLSPQATAAAAAAGSGGAAGTSTGSALASFLRNVVLAASLLVALVGFEGRVVFHGFGQYIVLPPPWNWAAVTFALFGCAAVGLLHMSGALGPNVDVTLAGSFLLLCTTAGSLAAGVPFPWLPAPLLAACGLSLFYESRSLREYLVFVVGAFLSCLWFVRHHFWFLEIDVSGMRLHTICKLAVAALVPALTVPGLVVARASSALVGALLVAQAVMLCIMEDRLYTAGHEDGAPEPLYPGYLVLATSVLGLAAARLLTARGRLPPAAAWLLHAMYGAKAAMLALPEAGLVPATAILLAAALAPLFLHGPSWLHNTPAGAAAAAASLPAFAAAALGIGASGASAGGGAAAARPAPARRLRLAPWQGLLHIVAVLAAVGLARFAVFDVVQFGLSARPSEGLLLGALLITAAAALTPLASHCYGGLLSGGRLGRFVAGLALLGCLMALLQPPMPLAGGARCPRLPLALCPRLWDERHVPMHSAEDVEVWGRGLSRREHWPRWLLIAAVVAGMVAGAGAAGGPGSLLAPPRKRSVAGRLLVGVGAGLLVGGYTALELLPDQVPLQVLVTASSVLAVLFVLLLAQPGAGGQLTLPGLALLWAVASGLALLLHAELPVPSVRANSRLFPDSKVQVEAEIYRATKASLLAVVAAHALLMAFALKLKMSAALRRRAAAVAGRDQANGGGAGGQPASFSISPSDLLCGVVPPSLFANTAAMLRLEGAGALALQRLAAEGLGWVPTVGNALTLTALALGLSLNAFLNGAGGEGGGAGSPEAIFMLAPVLLLLSQDPLILPGLTDRQRYAPPQLAISAYLLATGVAGALADVLAAGGAAAAAVGLPPMLFLAKELGLAVMAVPHHVLFLSYLWNQRPAPWGLALLLATPACVLPLAMADIPAIRFFGAVGAVVAVLQYFSMKHVRRVGMKPPPLFCPRLPPYPGISSIQLIDCDIEGPQPDVCGLRPLNGASVRLLPGQALAVRYANLASATAKLSRLVLSGERLRFTMDPVPPSPEPQSRTEDGPELGPGPHPKADDGSAGVGAGPNTAPQQLQRLLLASGLCPGLPALTSCLLEAYHGTPAYRACVGCVGVNIVAELGDPRDGPGEPLAWSGEASSLGDTSYFASRLPPGTDSLIFFLASVSSAPVHLWYSRSARVLYAPGAQVAVLPPRNATFGGVTPAPAEDAGAGGAAAGDPAAGEPRLSAEAASEQLAAAEWGGGMGA